MRRPTNLHSYGSVPVDEENSLGLLPSSPRSILSSRQKKLLGASYMCGIVLFAFYMFNLSEPYPQAAYVYQDGVTLSNLYSIESCMGREDTACCASTNYPALGGLDVVAMRDVHRGQLPPLGALAHAAALPTSAGTYVFFFLNDANRDKFVADPWRWAPKGGGFDTYALAADNKLKDPAALGPRADPAVWTVTLEDRLQLFATEDAKRAFLDDLKHFGDKVDRKWLEWYGKAEDGPFNTQCFQGTAPEALAEAAALYAAGALPLGAPSPEQAAAGRDFLGEPGRDPLATRRARAPAAAEVFFASEGEIRSVRLEEGTFRAFDLRTAVADTPGARAVTFDAAGRRLIWADAAGALRAAALEGRTGRYGAPAPALPSAAEEGAAAAPAAAPVTALAHSALDGRLYWAEAGGALKSADLSHPAAKPKAIARAGGAVTALAMDSEHLYFHEAAAAGGAAPAPGSIKRVAIGAYAFPKVETVVAEAGGGGGGGGGGRLLLAMTHGALYFADPEGGTVYRAAKEAGGASPPRALFAVPGGLDGLSVHFGRLYYSSAGRLFSGDTHDVMAAGAGAAAAAAAAAFLQGGQGGFHVEAWAPADGLALAPATEYTEERGDAPPFSEYPWAPGPIVELHRPTTLRVVAPKEGFEYEWLYNGETRPGPELVVLLTEDGEDRPVVLRELDPAAAGAHEGQGEAARELRTFLVGRRVRRELRRLTDGDRERFFQGLEAMVKTPLEEGRARYGPAFRNNDHFVHLHNVLAGARDCDHLHLGRGFLFNHVGITLEMEQALQVVDPALSIPFWDFTLDSHAVMTEHNGDWNKLWESPVFDPEWFGDCHNEHQTVTEGRWAWALKIPEDQWDNQVRNSYGQLRSPWNNNPFPYVQRFHEISGVPVFELNDGFPTCKHHYYVNVAHDRWRDYVQKVSSEPHGTVHGVLGGVKNDHHTFEGLAELLSERDVLALRVRSPHAPKEIWRSGLMECPEYCAPDTPAEECKCTCGPDLRARMEADLAVFDAYVSVGLATRFKYAYDEETVKDAMELVCQAGYIIGDQEESASPADPIFWPIHPTIERLFMWKLLNGGFEDDTWPEEENYTGPMRESLIKECSGHNPSDLLPWNLKMAGDTAPTRYTNSQMYALSNPEGDYRLPYVYDNFKWDHCLEEGYDFDSVGWVKL